MSKSTKCIVVVRTLLRCQSRGLITAAHHQQPRLVTPRVMTRASSKIVNMNNLNPNMIKLQYAVRGPLVIRAHEIQEEINKGAKKPFAKVIRANVGDAQAMGQKPITFFRQVLSCLLYPPHLESAGFPEDVKKKAKEILGGCGGGSVGSYSASHGIELIRRRVAQYIERRDGYPCDWQNVCLAAGASSAIKNVLQMFINTVDGKNSGVMVPIPQYPLYSAALAEFGLDLVGYYLDEDNNWGLDVKELERSLKEAKNCKVRAIVVINPGNPTGQVLSKENVQLIIKFAHENKLFIFADEVYQHNIYVDGGFHSFKKVLLEMGSPYDKMELASFMSASKGYMGECGLRGGWVELLNVDPKVQADLYKCISSMLCPTTIGQAAIDCVAGPPQSGEPSYELFAKEQSAVLQSLKDRAQMIAKAFNQMPGFKCNTVQGAMYAFPRIDIPNRAKEEAKKAGKPADVYYAFNLLENTGICIVPGSGFGQRPGTFHFRTTILPQPPALKEMLDIFKDFHHKFTEKYS